jgi:signal transduction histidine kinase
MPSEFRNIRSNRMSENQSGSANHCAAREGTGNTMENLLHISGTPAGGLALQLESVDAVERLKGVIQSITPMAQARGVTVEVNVPSYPLYINADPSQLDQILHSLLANSTKFTSHGGQVVVDVEHSDSEVRMRFSDNGRGIGRDVLPRIFEPFGSEVRGPIEQHSGLGIGLSAVRDLVEALDGSVMVDSEGIDQGAVFTLSFPLSAPRTPL